MYNLKTVSKQQPKISDFNFYQKSGVNLSKKFILMNPGIWVIVFLKMKRIEDRIILFCQRLL